MPKFSQLIKYNLADYLHSSKIILPLITFIVLQVSVYFPSLKPINIMNSFFVSTTYIFLIMIWLGFSYNTTEDEVSEQLLILKIKSFVRYYLSQTTVLLILCLCAAIIGALSPVLGNLLDGFTLFNRPFTVYDFLTGFLLFLSASFAGISFGNFFHRRYLLNQKYALTLALIATLLSLVSAGLVAKYQVFAIIAWIFPPISNLQAYFGTSNFLSIGPLLLLSGLFVLYGIGYNVLKISLLVKRKY